MRWFVISIIGSIILSLGIVLVVLGPNTPTYYAGGGTTILFNGAVLQGTAPSRCEIPVITIPNTLHVRIKAERPCTVELIHPNRTTLAIWENQTVYEDYVMTENGLWRVYVSSPSEPFVYGEIYTTAPFWSHPALIYAAMPLLLGSLSLLYSNNKRKLQGYFMDGVFEQNIGGRWIFLAWIPILISIGEAPTLIPAYSWLYALLIVLTVFIVFCTIGLAYVKMCISAKGLLIEAPFLNFLKHYETHQIYGFTVTKEKKQRWFLLHPIPSLSAKKEDQVTIFLSEALPKWLWVLSFGTRLYENKIVLRPKSLDNFKSAADKLGIVQKDIAAF